MRIAIAGAHGKMGRECARVFLSEGHECPFFISRSASNDGAWYTGFDALPDSLFCDCIVDFSSPSLLPSLLDYAVRCKTPAVLATTGYSTAQIEALAEAAKTIPIFMSRNMSVGVHITGKLCEILAGALFPAYDAEIVETHHASKKDAPSGTALYLADQIKKGSGCGTFVYDRRINQIRQRGEIGIHSLRGGSVVGRHTVNFFGMGESITIEHNAENRELFARGALAAAIFLYKKPPGLYGMDTLVESMLKPELQKFIQRISFLSPER